VLQVKAYTIVALQTVNVVLKGLQWEGVALLKLAVTASVLLQTVVGEMYIIVGLFEGVFIARSADVALAIKVYLPTSIDEHPHANIEFPAMVEQWPFDILLYHPQSVERLGTEELQDLIQFAEDFDTASLVEVGRLHQP